MSPPVEIMILKVGVHLNICTLCNVIKILTVKMCIKFLIGLILFREFKNDPEWMGRINAIAL